MAHGRRIVFFRRGLFSYTNLSVEALLRREFPEAELEVVDAERDWLARAPAVRLWALVAGVLAHPGHALARRYHPRDLALRSAWLARWLHRRAARHLRGREADVWFTLQTSSLFDQSVPGVPHFIYTDHTHLTNRYYPAWNRQKEFSGAWLAEERATYHRARHTFVMGGHVARSLVEHYGVPAARVSTIGAGSNSDWSRKPMANDGYRNGNILFVGVDWERKGGPQLDAAFTLVRERHPHATLTVVGCRPALSGPGRTIVGKVPLAEVFAFYPKASVFCVPTRVEPFGIVFIEAAAHCLPVVSLDLGALPEMVRHGQTGLLVPCDDVPALATALGDLLADPARCAAYGEAGRAHVEANFTWEVVGQRLRAGILHGLAHPA